MSQSAAPLQGEGARSQVAVAGSAAAQGTEGEEEECRASASGREEARRQLHTNLQSTMRRQTKPRFEESLEKVVRSIALYPIVADDGVVPHNLLVVIMV